MIHGLKMIAQGLPANCYAVLDDLGGFAQGKRVAFDGVYVYVRSTS